MKTRQRKKIISKVQDIARKILNDGGKDNQLYTWGLEELIQEAEKAKR